MLRQYRAGACQSLLEQQRVLVDEAEWDKLGEAARLRLDLAQQSHLAYPVTRRFGVSIHERGRGTNAAAVCGTNHINPLRGRKLIRRKNMPNVVVKDFCCSARERAQPIVSQHRKIVRQWHAGEFDSVNDLHRRERVNVHSWNSTLHGAKNVAVVELGKTMREPALYADLGGAKIPRLDSFTRHVIQTMEVGICFPGSSAEGAELASHKTDIG